jgi:hypothetical protein
MPVTELAAKRTGQGQEKAPFCPKKGHVILWIFVFPFPSFHTRKRRTSLGVQDATETEYGKAFKKLVNFLKRLNLRLDDSELS